jgi:hypothetical protein
MRVPVVELAVLGVSAESVHCGVTCQTELGGEARPFY